MKRNILLAIAGLLLSGLPLSAHPGHGHFHDSALHFFYSMEHILPVILAAAIFFYLIGRRLGKGRKV